MGQVRVGHGRPGILCYAKLWLSLRIQTPTNHGVEETLRIPSAAQGEHRRISLTDPRSSPEEGLWLVRADVPGSLGSLTPYNWVRRIASHIRSTFYSTALTIGKEDSARCSSCTGTDWEFSGCWVVAHRITYGRPFSESEYMNMSLA